MSAANPVALSYPRPDGGKQVGRNHSRAQREYARERDRLATCAAHLERFAEGLQSGRLSPLDQVEALVWLSRVERYLPDVEHEEGRLWRAAFRYATGR